MQAKAVIETFSIEQVVPYFQPIFDLNNHKVVRYECLSRLLTADDIIHLPSEFLFILNRAQSTALLTQRIIELSSAYCKPRDMRWNVNMFKTDLKDAQLMAWIQSFVSQFKAKSMGVELNYDSVKEHPHLLHKLIEKMPNVHITIDDVYDNDDALLALLACGVHAIKLRGGLVTQFARSGSGEDLINSIMNCCNTASCDLIAEHIEDDSTLEAVRSLGIKFGQGFFLSKPQGRMATLKHI